MACIVAIQLFNIDSISIDRLYMSRQMHRWWLTDVFAPASLRLSCMKFENGVEGNSWKMWAIPTEKEKIYQRALTLLNEAVDILRSPGTTTDHLQQLPAHPSVGSVQVPATSERGYWGENDEKWRVFFRFTVGAYLLVKLVPVNPSSDFDQVLPQVDPKKVLNQRKPGLTRSSACVNQAIEWMTKCDN